MQCRRMAREAARAQRRLMKVAQASVRQDAGGVKGRGKAAVAVDILFVRRLLGILRICIPQLLSPEAGLVAAQAVLLVSRTLLTEHISHLEAYCANHLIAMRFAPFMKGLLAFAGVALPTAVVNSGLKFLERRIQLAFQQRLTLHLHRSYMRNRAYYAACHLGGLTNPEQRITEDVEKFAASVSELYGHTFKPLLDVLLFTRSLGRIMGYKAQAALYSYYLLSAFVLRAVSPPLAAMTASESFLSGQLRSAHARLVSQAEEVAYNDPPAGVTERLILDQHLQRQLAYSRASSLQRFFQHVLDNYFIKYGATVVSLLTYAFPFWLRQRLEQASGSGEGGAGDREQLTQDYIRAMRLLQNNSRSIGDLVLLYKRVNSLAGHTSRVAELLEKVHHLQADGVRRSDLFASPPLPRSPAAAAGSGSNDDGSGDAAAGKLDGGNGERKGEDAGQRCSRAAARSWRVTEAGDVITFSAVALNAPDGTPLVRDVTFQVRRGQSVLLMGPNGAGKSSLFRVLAGLWPLQAGRISAPASIFYLSQRPYLVQGTLRDQLLYPLPPLAVWHAADAAARRQAGGDPSQVADTTLHSALAEVGLSYLLDRGQGWEQVQDWPSTLSGGEKQRLAMARLLVHVPAFAILDECTSAVNADGEAHLYEVVQARGITLLSIGHRPTLRRFHQMVIHFHGNQVAPGWHLETL